MASRHRSLAGLSTLLAVGIVLSGCSTGDAGSGPSATITGSNDDSNVELLPSVTGVEADVDGNSIRASWQSPADDRGAVEYRAFALDADSVPAYQCTSAAQECSMTDVSGGTYTVIVRAAYADGLGPVSEASAPVVVE